MKVEQQSTSLKGLKLNLKLKTINLSGGSFDVISTHCFIL